MDLTWNRFPPCGGLPEVSSTVDENTVAVKACYEAWVQLQGAEGGPVTTAAEAPRWCPVCGRRTKKHTREELDGLLPKPGRDSGGRPLIRGTLPSFPGKTIADLSAVHGPQTLKEYPRLALEETGAPSSRGFGFRGNLGEHD